MHVRIRLFARFAELCGTSEHDLELPDGASAGDAVEALREQIEGAASIPERPMVAINMSHSKLTDSLSDGDELALLPPLAGG